MAGKNDKWSMFKNYMHNELGITKEDIQNWIDEAVIEQIQLYVKNTFKYCDIDERINNEIRKTIREDYQIKDLIIKKIAESITFKN